MNAAIRRWTQDDAGFVYRILHETWLASYSSFIPKDELLEYLELHYSPGILKNIIQEPETHGYIAEADGVPAGYMRLKIEAEASNVFVSQLYVLPSYQKLGIGKKLMQTAVNDAISAGSDRLRIGVMVQNGASVRWYRSLGYRIEKVEPFTMGRTTVDHYIGSIEIKRAGRELPFHPEVHVPAERIFSVYTPHPEKSFGALCGGLFTRQRLLWKHFDEAVQSLDEVQIKTIPCRGFNAAVQYNQARLASVSAPVDADSIGRRPCFLCLDRLPPEQICILWRDSFLVLCNPAPIFRPHFTIVSKMHAPQEIVSHTDEMLELARDLSPFYSIFYNGPQCGASAPDHLHFQVSPWRAMPSEIDAVDAGRRILLYYKSHIAATTLKNYGRAVIILESTDCEQLKTYFFGLVDAWKTIAGLHDEPLMNVVCSYQERIWRLIIFPRKKHRPALYGKNEKEQILISPGAVDMAGLFIAPRLMDYERMDSVLVESIYAEVAEDEKFAERLIRGREI